MYLINVWFKICDQVITLCLKLDEIKKVESNHKYIGNSEFVEASLTSVDSTVEGQNCVSKRPEANFKDLTETLSN